MTRFTWDETWVGIAKNVARRSACALGQVGAVVVDHTNRVVATGYNGPPAGYPDQCITGCPRFFTRMNEGRTATYENCISIHAEANALLFCDRRDRVNGTIYVTSSPCIECAKLIANSGLARVVVTRDLEPVEHRDPQTGRDIIEKARLVYQVWTRD